MLYDLAAPCHFGVEAVVKRELQDLGYEITGTRDGRVDFRADPAGVVRADISLRTPERVLLRIGRFSAQTWDELFEGVKALPWEEFIPRDARFWVTKAVSVRSKLFSPSDIQRIVKKAMVDKLAVKYGLAHFPETGEPWPVRVFILNDEVDVCLDTTGDSLHKRGYRKTNVMAPVAENLAAALIMLTPWKADRILVDPFCGSGTFVIEAAMMAAHIAPGIHRSFTAEKWNSIFPENLWKEARREAYAAIDADVETDLQGYDKDPAAVDVARLAAEEAGVDEMVHFQVRDVSDLSHRKKYGFIITNPPYGMRIGGDDDASLAALYRTLGERYRGLDDWSMFILSAYPGTENAIGKSDKNRKIYNGMIETRFYQYFGAKPPARERRI